MNTASSTAKHDQSLERKLGALTFDVIVCTRNRPEDLRHCLESIERSTIPVHRVIVSDDSDDCGPAREVCADFSRAFHTQGPRKGLCANRNNALRHLAATHVLFLDDDALLDPVFIVTAAAPLTQLDSDQRSRVIVTGRERRNGKHVTAAREQSFLGFQQRVYEGNCGLRTVVINAAIFPADLFRETVFDEQLRYGYDEVDLTTRAVAAGYEIRSVPAAINGHNPSAANRDEYDGFVDASRLYVTFRRYLRTDGNRPRAARYAVVAPSHLYLAAVKREGPIGLASATRTLRLAIGYWREGRRGATHAPSLAEPVTQQ